MEAIVFSAEEIAATVSRLALEIANDFTSRPVSLLGVLKGALFLVADLARALPPGLDVEIRLSRRFQLRELAPLEW